jgi:hypothetical protein
MRTLSLTLTDIASFFFYMFTQGKGDWVFKLVTFHFIRHSPQLIELSLRDTNMTFKINIGSKSNNDLFFIFFFTCLHKGRERGIMIYFKSNSNFKG